MDKKQIGLLIRAARIEKGWSQQDLADELMTSQGHVSNMERGMARIDVEYLQRVADVLEKSLYHFLTPAESDMEVLDQTIQIMRSLPAGAIRDVTAANMLDMALGAQRRVLAERE
jgi:transcriptional regulator with XRE-family HTH domain